MLPVERIAPPEQPTDGRHPGRDRTAGQPLRLQVGGQLVRGGENAPPGVRIARRRPFDSDLRL